MSFVHGHARAAGWVVAHVRRPNRPEAGQLSLLPQAVLTEGADPVWRAPARGISRTNRREGHHLDGVAPCCAEAGVLDLWVADKGKLGRGEDDDDQRTSGKG